MRVWGEEGRGREPDKRGRGRGRWRDREDANGRATSWETRATRDRINVFVSKAAPVETRVILWPHSVISNLLRLLSAPRPRLLFHTRYPIFSLLSAFLSAPATFSLRRARKEKSQQRTHARTHVTCTFPEANESSYRNRACKSNIRTRAAMSRRDS